MEYKVPMENKNKFESKISIIGGIIFYGVFTLVGISTFFYLLSLSGNEFTEVIKKYAASGKGATIKTTAIVNLIYTFFGRSGCIVFLILGDLLILCTLLKEISTLRRYLHKERLFKMGLVSNMDDDDKPLGIVKRVKQLFKKSKGSSVFKYTRKDLRKMKKELEDMEKKSKR